MMARQNLAMVVGRRMNESAGAYRAGHVIGNKCFTTVVTKLFGATFTDILSGYRVFSRAFVKSFPVFSDGFEIETELTVHALTLGLPATEIPTPYRERAPGSTSKLNTYRDGIRILWMIVKLLKNEKPLQFFTAVGSVFLLTALTLAYPIVVSSCTQVVYAVPDRDSRYRVGGLCSHSVLVRVDSRHSNQRSS
jgi:hypothetical protein